MWWCVCVVVVRCVVLTSLTIVIARMECQAKSCGVNPCPSSLAERKWTQCVRYRGPAMIRVNPPRCVRRSSSWSFTRQEGEMAGNSAEPGQSVASRVAAVLLTFTDCNVHSLTEIARLTSLPVSTAHRLAAELAATDLLERDESGRYRVARSLRELGAAPWREPTLAERGPCVLDDLSEVTHRVARLGVLSGTAVNYIEKQPYLPVTSFDSGASLPAHATALGKVLLAFSPTRITDRLIAKGLPEFTRNTITAPDQLRHDLASIRRAGMAVSTGELESRNKRRRDARIHRSQGDFGTRGAGAGPTDRTRNAHRQHSSWRAGAWRASSSANCRQSCPSVGSCKRFLISSR